MITIIFNILLLFLLLTAFTAVFTDNIFNSVIVLSVFSGILVVVFIILQAPDVALAEAVIAAGLTTSFFIITINKTEGHHE